MKNIVYIIPSVILISKRIFSKWKFHNSSFNLHSVCSRHRTRYCMSYSFLTRFLFLRKLLFFRFFIRDAHACAWDWSRTDHVSIVCVYTHKPCNERDSAIRDASPKRVASCGCSIIAATGNQFLSANIHRERDIKFHTDRSTIDAIWQEVRVKTYKFKFAGFYSRWFLWHFPRREMEIEFFALSVHRFRRCDTTGAISHFHKWHLRLL